ncbi:MAG TPA: adenylate/guanylate cyclase domain-containing protein, partial [Kiloniellaceae bacterium]|nr:adenylate/guanylate cyclase domain-containing protein [Kiloniellaceae bacterium]
AERVHSEAHGHVANEMIEVDLSAVEAFLGRIQDPPSAAAKAIDDTAYRAIMFTDIAGSTEMTLRLGDALAVEAVRAHDSIVRRCLTRHGGSEVKHLGDGIMASFGQTCAAVDCAHAIQKTLASYNAESAHPIALRIGIHAGEPVEESRDLFGSAVQMASRICDAARPGAVLVSGDVKDACEGAGLCFEAIGAQPLKGFAEPVPLFCSMAS